MKTFRRNHLRRLVEAGRIEVVGNYHFDDLTGVSRDNAKGMPAAVAPADWRDRREGVCYLFATDFDTHTGRAWANEDGTVCLYVHGNCHFTFRVRPA